MRRFGFVFGPDGAGPYSALNNEGICRDALRRVRIDIQYPVSNIPFLIVI